MLAKSSTKIFTLLLLALPLALLVKLGPPKSSGDVRSLFPHTSETVSALNSIEHDFGETLVDTILIPLDGKDAEARDERFFQLEDELSQLELLQAVHSPKQAFGKLAPPIPLANDHWARFILEVPADLSDQDRNALDQALSKLLQPGELRSGPFMASEAATESVRREGERWGPVCFIVILISLLVLTRRVTTTIKLLAVPVVVVLNLQATLSWLQIPVLPLSQLATPLSLALVTTYSVYVGLLLIAGRDEPSIRSSMTQSITLAAATTTAGFVSLTLMDSSAVRQFAVIMSCVTIAGALLSLLITPRLMKSENTHTLHDLLRRIESWSRGRWGRHLVLGMLLLFLGVGIVKLDVDTNPLLFLPKGSHERWSIELSGQAFPGSHVLSVSLTGDVTPVSLSEISILNQKIAKLDGVHGVIDAGDFRAYRQKLIDLEPDAYIPFDEFGPLSITTADKTKTRLLVFNDLEGRALVVLAEKIRGLLPELQSFHGTVASRELVISEQSTGLARGLLESVCSALLLVCALLFLIFRSTALALIGLVPSVLPVLGIFGAMGLIYGDVNLGAALVAATALGMISDYTFHLLLTARALNGERLRRARELACAPFLLTAATLVVGFAPTIISPVLPVRQFGLLLSLSLGIGVWLNLTILPWLVRYHFEAQGSTGQTSK